MGRYTSVKNQVKVAKCFHWLCQFFLDCEFFEIGWPNENSQEKRSILDKKVNLS